MLTSNRWRYFLLVFIYKAAATSVIKVSDSTQQGININNDYGLDYNAQDNGRAFQINDDYLNYLNNSRRITKKPPIKPNRKNYNCQQCGIANTKRQRRRITMATTEPTRIRGGEKVKPPRRYPWQVGLLHFDSFSFFCGGSIINDQWILTAAHCFYETTWDSEGNCNEKTPSWFNEASPIRVSVGEHKQGIKGDDDENTIVYEVDVKDIIFHPYNIDECPSWDRYDFALLKLKKKIPFNSVIKPVCLPDNDNDKYIGDTAISTGWGETTNNHYSHVLREFTYRINSHKKCKRYWKGRDYARKKHLCAGPVAHKGTCNGDSGGPFVVEKGGKYIQVGVASFGALECGDLAPQVFGRVSDDKVLWWIRSITSGGGC